MHPNVYIPEAFLEKIRTILPAHLNMDDFVASCQKPLRKSIRVNTLKISVEAFLERAEAKVGNYHRFLGVKLAFGSMLMNRAYH